MFYYIRNFSNGFHINAIHFCNAFNALLLRVSIIYHVFYELYYHVTNIQ